MMIPPAATKRNFAILDQMALTTDFLNAVALAADRSPFDNHVLIRWQARMDGIFGSDTRYRLG
jgi:hypothetical protein